jgi:hypothetical protein
MRAKLEKTYQAVVIHFEIEGDRLLRKTRWLSHNRQHHHLAMGVVELSQIQGVIEDIRIGLKGQVHLLLLLKAQFLNLVCRTVLT